MLRAAVNNLFHLVSDTERNSCKGNDQTDLRSALCIDQVTPAAIQGMQSL